jgi:hypothetical protein
MLSHYFSFLLNIKRNPTPKLFSFGLQLLFCSQTLISKGLNLKDKYFFEAMSGGFGLINFAQVLVLNVDVELVVDVRDLDKLR